MIQIALYSSHAKKEERKRDFMIEKQQIKVKGGREKKSLLQPPCSCILKLVVTY